MTPTPDIGYHPARILIVDDERHNRELREVMLAVDGVSAVSEALKHRPDLIILDLGLPASDGFGCWSDSKRISTSR